MKPEEFYKAFKEVLKQFGDEVDDVVEEEINKSTLEARKEVSKKSPKSIGGPSGGRSQHYYTGWRSAPGKWKDGIYLREISQRVSDRSLVHLLEFGHITRDGTTRTIAQPHVSPTELKWADRAEKEIKRRLK